jgi:hypothetical protein
MLSAAVTGAVVSAVVYEHGADGNQYRVCVIVDGTRQVVGEPLPQSAIAARAVADEVIGSYFRKTVRPAHATHVEHN